MIYSLQRDLRKFKRPAQAKALQRFFKTGKGEYAEGDRFLGLYTKETRSVAKRYLDLALNDIAKLLSSNIHEERMAALMILVSQFKKGDEATKKKIYSFYLKNIEGVNNWDLVDSSAHKILGAYLFDKDDKSILYKLAVSKRMWERRIAIMATANFIGHGSFEETLKIAEILLPDKNDLIQKAVGWMLREVGKRDQELEEEFLKKHYKNIGRTALRYAIEKFPEGLRKKYLRGSLVTSNNKGEKKF